MGVPAAVRTQRYEGVNSMSALSKSSRGVPSRRCEMIRTVFVIAPNTDTRVNYGIVLEILSGSASLTPFRGDA